MKKNISPIILSLMLCACSTNTQTNSRTVTNQNSVESVLQSEINKESEDKEEKINSNESNNESKSSETNSKDIENISNTEIIDLTSMSATMIYSEVFSMMTEPEKYMGKTIKMTGTCNRYTDVKTGVDYYACIVSDATACCSQGIEFKLPKGEVYPQMGEEITVLGTFGSYTENNAEYYVLYDSKLM